MGELGKVRNPRTVIFRQGQYINFREDILPGRVYCNNECFHNIPQFAIWSLSINYLFNFQVVLLAPVIHAVLEYEQYKLMPDYAQGSVYQTHNDIMFLSVCSMYCLAGEDCISFSYNANSRTCSLSSDPVLYATGVPPEDGLLHFVAPNSNQICSRISLCFITLLTIYLKKNYLELMLCH